MVNSYIVLDMSDKVKSTIKLLNLCKSKAVQNLFCFKGLKHEGIYGIKCDVNVDFFHNILHSVMYMCNCLLPPLLLELK